MIFRKRDEMKALERELLARRPQPSESLVNALSARVTEDGRRSRLHVYARFSFACRGGRNAARRRGRSAGDRRGGSASARRGAIRRRTRLRARPRGADARASRSKPVVSAACRSSARSVCASTLVCARRSGAASSFARSWKRSLSMRAERRSRTCSTGVRRHRPKAARPRRVAPSVVRAGPVSLVVVPRRLHEPGFSELGERSIGQRARRGVDPATAPVGASSSAIASRGAPVHRGGLAHAAAHSDSDGSVRGGRLTERA